jgi:hypothetical protein
MTLEQALTLNDGDFVTHKHSAVSMKPLRVSAVWVNNKKSIVLVRIAAVGRDAWLDATGYELPERGKIWCDIHREWEWQADHRRAHPEYYQQKGKRR